MADLENVKLAKECRADTPFADQGGFHIKGINNLDVGNEKGFI